MFYLARVATNMAASVNLPSKYTSAAPFRAESMKPEEAISPGSRTAPGVWMQVRVPPSTAQGLLRQPDSACVRAIPSPCLTCSVHNDVGEGGGVPGRPQNKTRVDAICLELAECEFKGSESESLPRQPPSHPTMHEAAMTTRQYTSRQAT